MIVFRDGVSDSQLSLSATYEAEQFKKAFDIIDEKYKPGFAFIVVQKRINTRIFFKIGKGKELDNPPPGTILDHTVTKRDWYDFFLVSQVLSIVPTFFLVLICIILFSMLDKEPCRPPTTSSSLTPWSCRWTRCRGSATS